MRTQVNLPGQKTTIDYFPTPRDVWSTTHPTTEPDGDDQHKLYAFMVDPIHHPAFPPGSLLPDPELDLALPDIAELIDLEAPLVALRATRRARGAEVIDLDMLRRETQPPPC